MGETTNICTDLFEKSHGKIPTGRLFYRIKLHDIIKMDVI